MAYERQSCYRVPDFLMSINPQRSQAVSVDCMIILTAFGGTLYSDRETYNRYSLSEKAEA